MESLNIEDARRQLGDIVDRARHAGEPTLIMRYRTPAAVVVSADWYERAAAALGGSGES
jgi:prevent-host-death family protein